jgi:hypothetical protein
VGVLRAKYREVFGEEPRSKHRNQLFRRIAWRMQAGFEYQGRRYGSLSAIATQITGTRWNGLAFFGLARTRRAAKRISHV